MSTSNDRLDFIFRRRSVRIYSPGGITEATVTSLLQAAMAAPSAMAKDPWRFIVVRSESTLKSLAGVLPGGKMLASAPVGIAVCGDQDVALERHLSFLLQDCAAAIENLLLAAQALGLGACWVGVHPGEEAIRQVRQLLGLTGSILPIAIIAVGHPSEAPEARTRFNPQYVHLEKW